MTTPTRPILTTPRIQLLTDGRRAICFDATPATEPPRLKIKPDGEKQAVVGYRQTKASAANGGKANKNFFRFRTGGMRAFARSFRGQPFITAHDRGDVRMRGGTIADAYIEETDLEMLIVYELALTEDWAKTGFASGAIDRFSMGAWPTGEAFCTVHNAPLWSTDDCYDSFCWPGYTNADGKLVELEYQDAEGLELSAVNVPAVDDTYVIDRASQNAAPEATARADRWQVVAQLVASAGPIPWESPSSLADANVAALRAMAELTGRMPPGLAGLTGGARVGDFTGGPRPTSIAVNGPRREDTVNREQLCKSLGLPITATDEQIQAKLAELNASAAQAEVLRTQLADSGRTAQEAQTRAAELAAQADAAHVEAEITRLRASRQVTDQVVETLRAAAAGAGGRAAFDSSLRLVEAAAPVRTPTTVQPTTQIAAGAGGRPALQSDARPLDQGENLNAEPDAFELNRANPELATFSRWAGTTNAQIREHGARQFHVQANLKELADDTIKREALEAGRRSRKEIL